MNFYRTLMICYRKFEIFVTFLSQNEQVFLYMAAKLQPACAKVLHYDKEIRKSVTKSNR